MSEQDVTEVFEKCLGCRYMVALLQKIHDGVRRPGQLERAVDGMTAKVLSERLKRLVEHGVVEKTSYPEIPPRVEYTLTSFGQRLLEIIDEVDELHRRARIKP
ncbi:transcriptional regulator, HxlR family protein [Rhodopirellula maiorica SM1]|uniref:Transcriptional regulator, HxlR family protein n=1 Tax=Rhodopirellula maiorica SM1 TaxID=1265738 RepID=M5RUG8_9BACT|nr:helix-turn-helix domain-containing protein [Rhodopirellula maiorica]EMI22988.1 transcriptional regulator, HxlR family protein [Rhodopirellula maiorica SM1]